MKNYVLIGLVMSGLAACSSVPSNSNAADQGGAQKVGMANPASEYCVEQGGKLDIKKEANGEVGYCHLPNGQVIEEWVLFRANQAKCLPVEAQKLVGQSGLSDAQIQQLTKSQLIRRVAPNQPVTMDYHENRITVTIDPATQKISKASCG